MKKTKNLLYALPFLLLACNNEGKDSVEKADSANEVKKERADSLGAYQADAETSDFLVKAADAGMAEVKLGELAAQKAINLRVKELGGMMVTDHTAANAEVKALAAKRNITLPATTGEDKQKDITGLAEKSGKDFDKAYVKHMIKDHEQAIDLFKKAVEKSSDAEVRTFASDKLPKLQNHLDAFKEVEKSLK